MKYNVVVYPAGFSGCAWWRIRNPIECLLRHYDNLNITILDHIKIPQDKILEYTEKTDLAILQSPGSEIGNNIIKYHLYNIFLFENKIKKRIPVLIDYDDYSWDLSPINPRYKDLGTKEVIVKDKDGNEKWLWKNGHMGFDLFSNKKRYLSFEEGCKLASAITTTTDYLANKFKKYERPIHLLPNSIDFEKWGPLPRPQRMKNEIRLGWFGGDSHYKDLEQIKPIFKAITDKYSNVKLVFIIPGPWADLFEGIPKNQLEFHPWISLDLYPLFLASMHWDIGLCPLEETEFNRCKSSIKWQEYASMKVPCISTDMLPYSNDIESGSTGILVRNEGFLGAVCELIEDENKRIKIGQNAYDKVYQDYNLDKNCKLWNDLYLSYIKAN